MGIQSAEKIKNEMKTAHYFLHPAIKDMCPNVIFEAICNGLPVIYNPDVGSSEEIVGECGIPLNEFNLGKTIKDARVMMQDLQEKIIENKWKYTIQNAAYKYAEVIKRISKSSNN